MAHYIGTRCKEAGNVIDEVISSNEKTGSALAEKLNAAFLSDYKKSKATTFLLAIPDDVILEFAETDYFIDKKIVHTSGSIGLSDLQKLSEHVACIWPIYSIQKNNLPTRNDVPFVLQSSNQPIRKKAVSFLKCLTNNVTEAHDKQKAILHLSAVLVNNFTNHLFTQSEKLLQENNLSLEILQPIIESTVSKLRTNSPQNLQTGPAMRGDRKTIEKHLSLLEQHKVIQNIYTLLSQSIAENH